MSLRPTKVVEGKGLGLTLQSKSIIVVSSRVKPGPGPLITIKASSAALPSIALLVRP